MNDESAEEKQQARRPKKPYAPARLIEYGRAIDLTGGGAGSMQEGAMMTNAMRFP